MLNPGDMFSVDIEKVLFATGAPKGLPRSQDPRFVNRKKEGGAEEAAEEGSETKAEVVEATAAKAEVVEATAAKAEVKATGTEAVAAEGEEAAVTKEFNKERELAGGRDWWSDVNRSRLFDPTKPYRTPWRPRYYLSAFAFIPRYMEVNHSIGHAVYLRDPVARPGLSEVSAAGVG